MAHYSENIVKLNALLTLPKQQSSCNQFLYDFDHHQKAKILATLLANADLGTPELNRNTVADLLKGEVIWPKETGISEAISTFDDIQLLEELGAISFYADYLQTHFRSCCEQDYLHETVKPLNDALIDLRDITWGNNGFIKPFFKIDQKLAKNLIDRLDVKADLGRLKEVTLVGDEYHIQLLGGEPDRIIFNYLWTELNEISEVAEAFEKWLLVAKVYSGVFHPFLEGLTEDSKQSFLNQLMILIEDDDHLKKPLHILENQWRCDSHFESFFYQRNSAINLSINASSGESTSTIIDEGVTKFTLKDIQDKYIAPYEGLANRSLIKIYEDWIVKSNTHEYGRGQFHFYFGFPQILVSTDILIDHAAIYDYGKVKSLIEMSKERVGLEHILFNVLPSFDNFDFLLYLLCSKNTSSLALFLIIDHTPRMLISHRLTGKITFSTVLNLACNEFISIIFEGDSEISKNDVVELIIALAKRAINEEVSLEYSVNKEALDILLQELSIKQVEVISEILLECIIKDDTARNNNFPCWKYYLLFWLLEKNQTFGVLAEKDFSERVQMSIGNEYSVAFTLCLEPKKYPFGAIKLFDTLSWERVNSHSFIDVILSLVDKPKKWIKQHVLNEESNYYSKLGLVKSYLQVLLLLNQSSDEQDRILKKVLALVRVVGFSCEQHESGVFNDIVNNDYPLWELFCKWLGGLTDQRFFDLIDGLDDEMPLDKLLELYRDTNKEARRNKLLEMISSRRVESESLGLISIESALVSACGQGQFDLANKLLTKGLNLLDTRFGHSTNHHFVSIRKQWDAYQYKVELLLGVDNAKSTSDKILFIRGKKHTFLSGSNRHYSDDGFIKDYGWFRRSIEASILFESDPDKSYRYFDALYDETKEIQYAGKRFSAQLRVLEINSSEREEYQRALSQWVDSIKTVDLSSLESTDIQNWLHCMHELKRHDDIDKLWLELSAEQRMSIVIATNFCMSLKDRGDTYRAKDIYDKVKAYHKIDSLGEVAEEEMQILDDLILNDQDPKIVALLSKQYSDKPKSSNELKRSYDEIFSKSKSLSEIVNIISGGAVDEFLYSGLIKIMNEIQLRKKNLQIHVGSEKNTFRISGEDLFNDWVTSLFDSQYAYMGLSCRDQKRGGQSESGKTPGEIDFFLCDNRNDRISIMEAFRLFSNDTTVINTHLNKISGYDQECLGIVFIIGYCDVADFSGLCRKYEAATKVRTYAGFTKGLSDADELIARENSDTIRSYREVRYRGDKPITIYHLMLNLRFSG
ncbi:MAG: hypothetical protein JKY50_17020 [Oleispira sp.]|nr:hypothetical protein [Oleispira sp.]MBL4882119.1 hypothetical protein [Oleispira sp.]